MNRAGGHGGEGMRVKLGPFDMPERLAALEKAVARLCAIKCVRVKRAQVP